MAPPYPETNPPGSVGKQIRVFYFGHMTDYHKRPTIKSEPIRKSAAFERCTLRIRCSGDKTDTTVLAHLNSNFKGIGNKSPDIFGVYACHLCHESLDRGGIDKADQLRALQETQMRLVEKGLLKIKMRG